MSRRPFYTDEEANYLRGALNDSASPITSSADCFRQNNSARSTQGAVARDWPEWRASSRGVLNEEIESGANSAGWLGCVGREVGRPDASSSVSTSEVSTAQSGWVVNGPRLDFDNKGFQLLASMGWSEGQGLGKSEQGIVDPILTPLKTNRAGLGSSTKREGGDKSKKRRWEENERRELVEWLNRLPSHQLCATEQELAHQLRRDLPIIGESRPLTALGHIIRQLRRYPQSKLEEWIVHRNGGIVDTEGQQEGACNVWTDEQRAGMEAWLLADASRQWNGDVRWLACRAKKDLATPLRDNRVGMIMSMIRRIRAES